jgi:hypothetical protein
MAMDPVSGVLLGLGIIVALGCLSSRECLGDCDKPTSGDYQQAAQAKARAIAVQPT